MQQKAFSWLLGYTSHVITDVTIHPVIELKVGEYQKNKDKHRICEMHQDAYIFQRLNLGEVGLAEHLDSGIWGCCCDKPIAEARLGYREHLAEHARDLLSELIPD